jgi:hypothetical protein
MWRDSAWFMEPVWVRGAGKVLSPSSKYAGMRRRPSTFRSTSNQPVPIFSQRRCAKLSPASRIWCWSDIPYRG